MLVFAFGLWSATAGRPRVNFSRNRGQAEAYWAYDAMMEGRYAQAERWFKDATAYRPGVSEYWYDLGFAQSRLMHTADALASFQHSIALGDPRGEVAIGNFYQNGAYGLPKDETKAIAHYQRASALGDPDGEKAIAWLYATSKDPAVFNPAAALQYARRAVEADKDDPDAARLDTLAKAYAVNGQFEEAVKAETQALVHADPDDVKQFKQRLHEYQAAGGPKKLQIR
jgi:tetratricopeptide (TPR) repeat protein